MAILKHIASKNADYGEALEYLVFEHDEKTGKPIRNEEGKLVMRNRFIIDGINCEAFAFDKACEILNAKYHKNCTRGEIKSHHYILSFDPKDSTECGLTLERAQELGMEFAVRNFPGHQILVCTHDEGHNKSRNIHVHMVLNSIRMLDVERQPFMEREIDCKAGYKHHVTKEYFNYLLRDVMDMCQREGLHQVDLLSPAATKITDREYRAQQRGQKELDELNEQIVAMQMKPTTTIFQTQKQFLRDAILKEAAQASSLEEFQNLLKERHGITVKEQRGAFSYLHPDRKKYIRARALGNDYEKEHILELISRGIHEREQAAVEEEAASNRINTEESTVTFLGVCYSTVYNPSYDYYANPAAILFVHSDLQLVTDLQTCVKAQYSEAYARQVDLSNLLKASRTICYLQEHGIGSREELRQEKSNAVERVSSAETALEKTEEQIRKINEKIHYAGQYYSTKAVNKEYRSALVKSWFRRQHTEELDRYDEAVSYFKNTIGERIPPMKDLKQWKEDLLQQKASQENSLRIAVRDRDELNTAAYNVSWILSTERVNNKEIENPLKRKTPKRKPEISL